MADYVDTTTLIDRVTALGHAQHVAARHIRYGRVRVNGEPVTDPYTVVADTATVEVLLFADPKREDST